MKKTDIEKNKAAKLRGGVQSGAIASRFGAAVPVAPDRREQRRQDQAAGLVPFACKLTDELVQQLRTLAEQEDGNLTAVTERLLRAGLSAEGTSPAATEPAAKKTAAKKTTKAD